jgi:hypothetical protein
MLTFRRSLGQYAFLSSGARRRKAPYRRSASRRLVIVAGSLFPDRSRRARWSAEVMSVAGADSKTAFGQGDTAPVLSVVSPRSGFVCRLMHH